MNPELEDYAREFIKKNLEKCSPEQFMVFKKMYSVKKLDANINQVVEKLPKSQLDWAMHQVINTLLKERIEPWSYRKTSTS
ncbi:MAG: hypothetical protein R3250_03705 [Melioribacteraceae bacterium]|nr:hypothetical protein [Melioribacteraceae bacterium]